MIEEKKPIENEEDIDIEEMEEKELLNDYQVVRREFFAHTFDAAVTFRYDSLSFNAAAINKIPETMYVQILINPEKRKMVVKMCDVDTKNAAKWARLDKKTGKRASRKMTGRMFTAKLYDMMGWAPENRYKIQGTLMRCKEEIILVFNLEETEIFVPRNKNDDDATRSKRSYFPESWRDSFGVTYGELKKSIGVDILDGFAVMEVVKPKNRSPKVPAGYEMKEVKSDGADGK